MPPSIPPPPTPPSFMLFCHECDHGFISRRPHLGRRPGPHPESGPGSPDILSCEDLKQLKVGHTIAMYQSDTHIMSTLQYRRKDVESDFNISSRPVHCKF